VLPEQAGAAISFHWISVMHQAVTALMIGAIPTGRLHTMRKSLACAVATAVVPAPVNARRSTAMITGAPLIVAIGPGHSLVTSSSE
jgi:hypothetical protein